MSVPEQKLLNLFKTLPDREKEEVLDFVEYIKKKSRKKIKKIAANIPIGDEDLSESDVESIKQAREEFKKGKTFSMEEIEKKYGIK
jgi:tyrosyl-tRNA synthetase